MKKRLLPFLLLFLFVNSALMAQARYQLQVGGICSRATLSLLTPTGSVDFQSGSVYSTIDIGTHYFGFASKLGTFKSSNTTDIENLDKIFNLNYNTIEFTPDNPHVSIKELAKGESVNIQIPGLLKVSKVRVPITIPVNFSRDKNGLYHFSTDFTVNATSFGNKIPDELKSTFDGSFRVQLTY